MLWFRRRRRRVPPPVLLPSIDRLSELIERVVALLDEVALPSERRPAREEPAKEIVPPQHNPGQVSDGWVAFVASPDGYRLLQRDGRPPVGGAALELDGDVFVVHRLGPSPLPGDRRRCAFLDRKEPPLAERTFDR